MSSFELKLGDCLETLRGMADNSVDAVVTDPPYGLSFMGKKWDYDVPGVDVWTECLRVLKPGGHLLAFAGTRTQHRMAVRIEDAGFEIRDMIAWIYGSGFPKSLDVSKAIDKAAGAERVVIGVDSDKARRQPNSGFSPVLDKGSSFAGGNADITAPATEAAQQWQGWGTALKPALEPITVARKPFASTVSANVLQWGTGAINIDASRISGESTARHTLKVMSSKGAVGGALGNQGHEYAERESAFATGSDMGRWPANLILSDCPEVVAGFPVTKSGTLTPEMNVKASTGWSGGSQADRVKSTFTANEGSAARFFKQVSPEAEDLEAARFMYCAKASRADRDSGLDDFDLVRTGAMEATADASMLTSAGNERTTERRNVHPTVKPVALMRYLVRLVTPLGGVVLDPFAGSGSTLKAAILEGFRCIGIEREEEYLEIERARCAHALSGMTGTSKQDFVNDSLDQKTQNHGKAEYGEQRCFDL